MTDFLTHLANRVTAIEKILQERLGVNFWTDDGTLTHYSLEQAKLDVNAAMHRPAEPIYGYRGSKSETRKELMAEFQGTLDKKNAEIKAWQDRFWSLAGHLMTLAKTEVQTYCVDRVIKAFPLPQETTDDFPLKEVYNSEVERP